jgi:hypothetical protein
MRSEFSDGQAPSEEQGEEAGTYEPPALEVLGTFAELTQQGTASTDELLNDGSIE